MRYEELDKVPAYEPAVWEDGKLVNADKPVLWSGKVPPPEIGAKVKINFFGTVTVTGYFITRKWLGIVTEPQNPPEWWWLNNEDGKARFFGRDICDEK